MENFDLGGEFDTLRAGVEILADAGRESAGEFKTRLDEIERRWEQLIADLAQLQLDVFKELQ